jgi:hypothetical protein
MDGMDDGALVNPLPFIASRPLGHISQSLSLAMVITTGIGVKRMSRYTGGEGREVQQLE